MYSSVQDMGSVVSFGLGKILRPKPRQSIRIAAAGTIFAHSQKSDAAFAANVEAAPIEGLFHIRGRSLVPIPSRSGFPRDSSSSGREA